VWCGFRGIRLKAPVPVGHRERLDCEQLMLAVSLKLGLPFFAKYHEKEIKKLIEEIQK